MSIAAPAMSWSHALCWGIPEGHVSGDWLDTLLSFSARSCTVHCAVLGHHVRHGEPFAKVFARVCACQQLVHQLLRKPTLVDLRLRLRLG